MTVCQGLGDDVRGPLQDDGVLHPMEQGIEEDQDPGERLADGVDVAELLGQHDAPPAG
jgi:hypothetical protein